MKKHSDADSIQAFQEQLLQLKQQNELLKNQLMTTSLINELTKVMYTTTDPDNIIHTILLGIHEIAGFDRIILFNLNKEEFNLTPSAWFGIKSTQKKDFSIPLGFEGGEITDAIFLNRHLIVEDVLQDDDIFRQMFDSQSYIVIPLVGRTIPQYTLPAQGEELLPEDEDSDGTGKEKSARKPDKPLTEDERRKEVLVSTEFNTQGVFWMDRRKSKVPITSDDITTLSLIINQAGIIIENIRMFNALEIANDNLQNANSQLKIVNHDLRTAQYKINKDLEHAQTIQQGLLPQNIPDTPSLAIKATYIPAAAVGGDYYDVFEITEGIYGLIVADVSGHGVSSALIMSMVKVLIKTFTTTTDGPQKILEKINTIFQTEIKTTNFVTVFFAILDTNSRKFYYTSAGHCPVLFINRKDKSYSQVKADGLFLGVFPDMMLNETCTTYEPGTMRLILYTDGLTEARNENNEMYELERLITISLKTLENTTEKACSKILSHQKKFCGKHTEPEDDITLLVVDF